MSKIKLKKDELSSDMVKNFLKDHHEGYILLTCSKPNDQGNMEIEMSFDGDEIIVSYLVDSANNLIGEGAVPSSLDVGN